jgi:malate/lactate dehydrogenase
VNPSCSFTSEEVKYLTSRIQNGGTEVVEVYFSLQSTNTPKSYAASLMHDEGRKVSSTNPFYSFSAMYVASVLRPITAH